MCVGRVGRRWRCSCRYVLTGSTATDHSVDRKHSCRPQSIRKALTARAALFTPGCTPSWLFSFVEPLVGSRCHASQRGCHSLKLRAGERRVGKGCVQRSDGLGKRSLMSRRPPRERICIGKRRGLPGSPCLSGIGVDFGLLRIHLWGGSLFRLLVCALLNVATCNLACWG